MTFIRTVPEDEADGMVGKMYSEAKAAHGHLPNMVRTFSHRPQVMEAWGALLDSIRGGMDTRRYELVTLAAARALRSSYCMLAHGSVLLDGFYASEELQSIVNDVDACSLNATDRTIMQFAEQVVRDATAIRQSDIEKLRARGLSDAEIFDITTAAAVRCFFSKTLDALGARPIDDA